MIELGRAEPLARATEPFPVEEPVLREKLGHLEDYKSAERKAKPRADSEVGRAGRLSLSGSWVAAYGTIQSPSKLEAPVPPTISNPRNIAGNGYGVNGSVPARLLVIKSIDVLPVASGPVP